MKFGIKKKDTSDLNSRIETLEKSLKLLTSCNNRVITEMVKEELNVKDIKERLVKVEKVIEKEKTGNMYG